MAIMGLKKSLEPELLAFLRLSDRSARPRTMLENHEVAEEEEEEGEEEEEEAATEAADGGEEDSERFISTGGQKKTTWRRQPFATTP